LWPDAGSRRELSCLAAAIKGECGGREVQATDIHLTLFFLGTVPPERIAAVREAAQTIAAAPFRLAIDRLEYWRHNRIAWAGTQRCPAELSQLVARLQAALEPHGYAAEHRPFVPHVTLVRDALRAPRTVAAPALEWTARDFALVQSTPSRRPRYETLERWALKPLTV
jgi:2'-5' RNA ligase